MKLCCQIGTEFLHSNLQVLKCPIFLTVKYYSFYIRLRCFPKVTLMAKPTERNEI